MKNQRIIIITFLFVIGIIIVLLFRPRRPTNNASLSPPSNIPSTSQQIHQNAKSADAQQRPQSIALRPSFPAGGTASPSDIIELSNTVQREWVDKIVRPIEFYGKVVDENTQAVAGASVSFDYTRFAHPESSFATNTISDSSGLFSLSGVKGSTLGVQVAKAGYYSVKADSETQYDYMLHSASEPFHPDPVSPVIFHLRKKGTGTDLVTSQSGIKQKFVFSTPLDGTPVSVDLLGRKLAPNGPLQISQVTPENSPGKDAWSIRMEISSGGFIEQSDEFPFEAPESGYKPVVEYDFNSGTTNWVNSVRKSYYIVFGQPPCYGWLVLETQIGMDGARLQYAINPNGSRYLEPKK